MLPKGAPSLDFVRVGSAPDETPIAAAVAAVAYGSYREIAPSKYKLNVFRSGDRSAPLANVDVPLDAGQFATVIAHGDARQPKVEALNDTVTEKDVAGSLNVWNFFPGVVVTVSAGQPTSGPLGYDRRGALTGLPLVTVPVKLTSKLPNGTPIDATVDVQFSAKAKRATLLLIPDSYDRFRPRVVMDGVAD